MSGTNSRRLSEAGKAITSEDAAGFLERRGSGSLGWGIKSARTPILKGTDRKKGEDEDESLEDQGVMSDAESGEGDENKTPPSEPLHSGKTEKRRRKKEKASERPFLTNIQSHESEEIENLEFVDFKDLPKLQKIESNVKGQFVGSSHKFERPVTGFRIRVRLLKYPSFSERAKWPGDLMVLEDRTFSWQEKIFSKSEADKYSEKVHIKSELDQKYYDEIKENPGCIGTYLHSYTDSDYFVIRQEEKTLVTKCPAYHYKTDRKFSDTSAELKSINSEGESMYDRESESDDGSTFLVSSRKKSQPFKSQKDRVLKKRSNQEELRLAEKQKKEEQKEKKEAEALLVKQHREEERIVKDALKKSKKQLDAEKKQSRLEDQVRRDQETRDAAVKRYLGTKRPSAAISARMLTTQTPPKRLPPRRIKGNVKKDRESSSPREDSSYPVEEFKETKSDQKSLDSDSKIDPGKDKILTKKRKSKRRTKKKSDSPVQSDDGEYEKLTKSSPPNKKEDASSLKVSNSSGARPIWRVAHRRFLERSGLQPPQSLYIMATIPHMNRRKREICVCSIKAYPKSSIVVLKPSFGYRIIEAKRNHVYRLSWELQSSHSLESYDKTGIAEKLVDKTFSRINQHYSIRMENQRRAFDEMGDMFEVVPLNEMRLVVMGEIISAEGFEAEPLCVHYLVEMPKGWRNDSSTSNLYGITHNSFVTDEGIAHFSQDFFFQLVFSMDSVHQEDTYLRPMILIMVMGIGSLGRVRYEGYAYINIPSTPGSHVVRAQTWKPKCRSTIEKMQKVFLGVSPSLQDIHSVHIPVTDQGEGRRANRLGLQTEPSGFVKIRLNVIHQVPLSYRDESSKLDLLEKMSSATILKSVQAVIEAFQRARKRALHVKSSSSSKDAKTSHLLQL